MLSRTNILSLIAPVHKRLRSQKLDRFFEALKPMPQETLLDIGGGVGITGEFARLYHYFTSVQVVNLDPVAIDANELRHVRLSVANGCSLPYEDQSFDWVFSNAVIEHVGGPAEQRQFALEVQRVARKGYFVATPNRMFPLEPHTLLPFYQFLSPKLQRKVLPFSFGYVLEYEAIHLLSAGDLRNLFPGASIQKMGVPLLPNNLVAFRRLDASKTAEKVA